MKLKIFATECRGFRVVKAVAFTVDTQQKRRQKTFTVRTVAPEFAATEMQRAFESAAYRWEQKLRVIPGWEDHEQQQELQV